VLKLTLTEVRGFSPRTIYGRRSLPSKKDLNDFDFKEFDFNNLTLKKLILMIFAFIFCGFRN
jgi:hypothetical protein